MHFKRIVSIPLVTLAVVFASSTTRAQLVRVDFAGYVTSGYGGPFDASVGFGTPIVGFYLFDRATPDADPSPLLGKYLQSGVPLGMYVSLGNYTFAPDERSEHRIDVRPARPGEPQPLDYALFGTTNGRLSQPLYDRNNPFFYFIDRPGTVLGSDALDAVPLDIDRWDNVFFGFDTYRNTQGAAFLRGTITNVTHRVVAVPEPSAFAVLFAGGLLLPLARRRTRI